MLDRLLDASFNRAREALRVLEDLARFELSDAAAQRTLKALRHALSALERPIAARLLAARESARDVGRGSDVGGARSPREIAASNFKRAQEALRSIEEAGRGELAPMASRMRYDVYGLEQRLLPRFRRPFGDVRLYVILDSRFGRLERQAGEAVAGGADALQLREQADDRDLLRMARALKGDALLLVNNRADIAAAAGADGVHVGARDLPVAEARRLLVGGIVGATSHSLAEARRVADADYISCGPVFPSTTKPGLPAKGLDYLAGALTLGVPVVCIGGITRDNIRLLVKRGARCVAVCAGVVGARTIRSAARAIRRLLP